MSTSSFLGYGRGRNVNDIKKEKICRWSNSFYHAELLDGTFDFFIKNICVWNCLYIIIFYSPVFS